MSHQDNLRRIEIVSDKLADIKHKVVFVGGSTVSMYASDAESFKARVTDDVDGIVEVVSYPAHAMFEEELRKHGFVNDIESGIRCRYLVRHKPEDIVVDIMPTNEVHMGFKNRWYPDGFKHSMNYEISANKSVKILTAPYFIATKLEAFKGRGGDNGIISHDFEDIVYVLEHRYSIWDELQVADDGVKKYLKAEFEALLSHQDFEEWLDYHVLFLSPPSSQMILTNLRDFVKTT